LPSLVEGAGRLCPASAANGCSAHLDRTVGDAGSGLRLALLQVDLSALVAAQHENADLALAYQQQFEQRRAATSAIVARAVERGDRAPDADGDLLLDLLAGIVAQRVLLRRLPLHDDFPEMIVDQLLAGFAPARGRRRQG